MNGNNTARDWETSERDWCVVYAPSHDRQPDPFLKGEKPGRSPVPAAGGAVPDNC